MMPDTCTLIVVTTMTLQMCYTDNVCQKSPDGQREFCTGYQPKSCSGVRYPTYDCKRPDGTSYVYEDRNFSTSTIHVEPN